RRQRRETQDEDVEACPPHSRDPNLWDDLAHSEEDRPCRRALPPAFRIRSGSTASGEAGGAIRRRALALRNDLEALAWSRPRRGRHPLSRLGAEGDLPHGEDPRWTHRGTGA